jgi:hypothetical protein
MGDSGVCVVLHVLGTVCLHGLFTHMIVSFCLYDTNWPQCVVLNRERGLSP